MEEGMSGENQSGQPSPIDTENVFRPDSITNVQKNDGLGKYTFVILLLLLVTAVLVFTTYYFFDQDNKSKATVSQSNKNGSDVATRTIVPTPSVSQLPSDAVNVESIVSTVVTSNPDFKFTKIDPKVFDFQIDNSTKKIVTGIGYTADISGDVTSLEEKIVNDFIKLGFIENQYNLAGPDFGAVTYGIERGNAVCIIKTGYFDPKIPDKRILDVDCGILE